MNEEISNKTFQNIIYDKSFVNQANNKNDGN